MLSAIIASAILTFHAPPSPDFNGDGVVDVSDLLTLLSQWGPCGGDDCPFDLNLDGTVDVSDLLILLGHWGPLATAQHHNLHTVRDLLAQSEEKQIAIVVLGDSRSSWRNNRFHGAAFRHWDVQWAGLFIEGASNNNGRADGLGAVISLPTGMSSGTAPPGETLPHSGIENRWPVRIAEQWVTGTPSNPHFGRYTAAHSTAGGIMVGDPPLNTFKRGDPSQGRAITGIDLFHLANDDVSRWLPFRAQAGTNATESGFLPLVSFAAPSGPSATHVINHDVLPGTEPPTTGEQIYWRLRHTTDPGEGDHGHAWIGSRLNFEGGKGCILAAVAQGGWSTSDHMPPDVYGNGDNTDWKYSDGAFQEWYAKCIRADHALVRIELGQNMNTLGGNFIEWNGITSGNFKHHIRTVAERAVANLSAAGVRTVVVQLVAPWQASGASVNRMTAMRADLLELAQEEGWAYYDQQGALIDGGFTNHDGDLDAVYRTDAAHQNYAGMNLLGELEWATISADRTAR